MFLKSKGYSIIEKLGNGAYASVFSAKDSKGVLCTVKVTRSEERQDHAQNEKEILEVLQDGPNFPKFLEFEYDPIYYMSLIKQTATP